MNDGCKGESPGHNNSMFQNCRKSASTFKKGGSIRKADEAYDWLIVIT